MEQQLSIEETLVQCIHTLSENEDMDMAINSLLEIIGRFYQADRSFIFEYNQWNNTVSNTYEWYREGVESDLPKLQNLPAGLVEQWKEDVRRFRSILHFT